jgi:hypothetical protein
MIADTLSPLLAAYPSHPFSEETAILYARMLSDIPEDRLRYAVLEHIAESNYFPTIAELRRKAAGNDSAEKEWCEIVRAFRENTSPQISAEARAALDGLGGMGYIRYNGVNGMDRAHFFRLYEAARRERELEERRPAIEAMINERKALN